MACKHQWLRSVTFPNTFHKGYYCGKCGLAQGSPLKEE